MEEEKTYVKIIEDFLKQRGGASASEIYAEVEREKKNRSRHWHSIVRNQLYYARKFVKVDDKWTLKKTLLI